MPRARIEIPDFDGLLRRWYEGEPVTALTAETGISRWVLDRRFSEAAQEYGRRKVLLFLSEAEEEPSWQNVMDALWEKRLDVSWLLGELAWKGEVRERRVGREPDPKVFCTFYYRLTAKGWDAVKELENQGEGK